MGLITRRLRFGLLASALLLVIGGLAFADEGVELTDNGDEADVELSFSIGDGEDGKKTLSWSFDPLVDCSDPEALDESCETGDIEPNEDGEFNHGSYVSFFAENLEEGPGRGCLIAAVAQSGAGLPEDSGQAADSGTVQSPCPAGLWTWLQEKDAAEAEGEGVGPPPFVTENGGGPPFGNGSGNGRGNGGGTDDD